MRSNFSHLKVLELASVLAGPLTGSFFAELGARAIKVENKTTEGDVTRTWRLPNEPNKGVSAYYAAANAHKETVMLDLNQADELNDLHELISGADVLITNFKKGDDVKFSLDKSRLKQLNPKLIHGSIIGFAQDASRAAYDVVLQAETGFMSMNGQPEGPPTKMPVAMVDVLAAHQLKEGLLVALLTHAKHPDFYEVVVNLEHAAISALVNQASNYLMTNHVVGRKGSLHPNIAPYGELLLMKDNRHVVLAIGSDKQFNKLCQFLACEVLTRDQRFTNNTLRVANRTKLNDLLQKQAHKFTSTALLNYCKQAHVPAGLIKTIDEVLDAPAGKALIDEEWINGQKLSRVSNIAFQIKTDG